MHFLLGFLLGYYTRNRPLLAATLLGFALVCFIVLPAIALSGLALSVRRERLSRPPQTRVPQLVGLDYKTAETTLHNSKLNIRVLAHRYDPVVEPGKILSILLRNRWQPEEEQSEQCKRKAKKVFIHQ